ncbi:hypothetical protein BCR35DRAFT_350980 [Leucosporidium creatinivorum]|uniref:Uncharacterized protein n=1 Tax=Leucosporidium creatinivorum TaxID=106004 RepID=A0A1Y2FYQ1_9BASI|nr:hypothetical protein BCR35DRAFT_350980 [Leucosporidium creatinivorum]
MKIQLLAILPLVTYTLAKPHGLVRRAVGDPCTQDSECDAGVVCSATSTSGGSTVCADADVVDGGACQTGSQCASTSCSAGFCDVTGGGGGGLANDNDPCTLSSECSSAFCAGSTQTCQQPSSVTGLEFGSHCFDSSNCLTNSECGCPGGPGTCNADETQCLRLAAGVACTEDIVCADYYCLSGTCADKTTLVNDGDHCILPSNCPAAVAPSTSPSTCQCPPGEPSCTGTDKNVCLPPAGGSTTKTATGDACTDSTSCFSGICDTGSGTCSPLLSGADIGGECSADADCLGWSDNENLSSSYCQTGESPPTCKPSEVTATGKNCAGASQHCFSGLDRCVDRDGSKVCDPPTTLGQSGDYCSADADCEANHKCSGVITNALSASRGITPGQCVTDGSTTVIVATGGDCDGTTKVCYSGKDQCSSSKCLPPKTLKGPGEACSATEDCATPTTGTVSCDGLTDTVGSGVCKVSSDSTGGDVTETITTTLQVTTTINGVVTVQPQTVTLTQRVSGGSNGGGTDTTRSASPVSRTASATSRPSSAGSRSLGEVGVAVGAVGIAMVLVIL